MNIKLNENLLKMVKQVADEKSFDFDILLNIIFASGIQATLNNINFEYSADNEVLKRELKALYKAVEILEQFKQQDK